MNSLLSIVSPDVSFGIAPNLAVGAFVYQTRTQAAVSPDAPWAFLKRRVDLYVSLQSLAADWSQSHSLAPP
jgi:hypothetical protein